MRIDLHVHSAISDGTDTIPHLIEAAEDAGLGAFALCDHDTFDGVEEAQRLGERVGIAVLNGVEISSHGDVGDDQRPVHVLGYGCHHDDLALGAILARIRAGRSGRVEAIIDKLADLGLPLTVEEVQAQAVRAASIGRPHIADAMVARGYAANRDEVFARWLYNGGPADVTRYTPTVPEVLDAIRAAHGVAVIAHPWSRGTDAVLTPDVIATLAAEHGLAGVEADHLDHSEAQRAALKELAARLGLLVTGSSDYHGSGKLNHPLGACLTAEPVYREILARIDDQGGHR
ncbi:MAG: PHP domain-containing protein [Propionibacteriaceae bacterium]|jgi:predicted metal-dependent phosphoesterase TrpH|nr:PHP domain-containing protein [Propionibacteriaceae bacterium]